MEWEQDIGNGVVLDFIETSTWDDAVALWCDECGHSYAENPYWSLRKTHGLHTSGTGHNMRRLAIAN